jgi:hypothetical protein
MSELREAAERVRTGFTYYQCPDSWQECNDARLIAEAWIAEHPADDDEPITEEWLEQLAFTHNDSWYFRSPAQTSMQADVTLIRWSGGWSVKVSDRFTSVLTANVKTRGDLRLLAKALGIGLEAR